MPEFMSLPLGLLWREPWSEPRDMEAHEVFPFEALAGEIAEHRIHVAARTDRGLSLPIDEVGLLDDLRRVERLQAIISDSMPQPFWHESVRVYIMGFMLTF